MPSEEKTRRAMSSEKAFGNMMYPEPRRQEKSPLKPQTNKSLDFKYQILVGNLTFKECVNVLHYGRLIFKFLLTLKVTEYASDKELIQLSKWLM
jgi:hypothetical protein